MKPGAANPFPLNALLNFQTGAMSEGMAEPSVKPEGEHEHLTTQSGGGSSVHNEGARERRLPLTSFELGVVISIFAMFIIALFSIYFTMPTVNHSLLKLPRTVAELRLLTDYVSLYTDKYKIQVLLGYCTTYIFMQTFMIPGTIVMSLLAGSLFGAAQGMFLVIFTATTGASCCYFLSKLIGRPLALWMWPDKLRLFTGEVSKRRAYLFNYMLFLRITPTLPNTFINVCSPIVDVPYPTFLVATVIGLMPATFITVRAGLALNDLNSFSQLYDFQTVAVLFFIGIASIVPTLMGNSANSELERPHAS